MNFTAPPPSRHGAPPRHAALSRLASLAVLDPDALHALEQSLAGARHYNPWQEIVSEGLEIHEPLMLVSGFAARMRLMRDGRRQFLSFILPGELIGMCYHRRPLAVSTILALTPVDVCVPPSPRTHDALDEAYGMSAALDEAYLLAHITRLGRLNAQERILDLFLELHERLGRADLAHEGRFDLPITQETLADSVGLTPVHVNRTLQILRRARELSWKAGHVELSDPAALANRIGRHPIRVSARVA